MTDFIVLRAEREFDKKRNGEERLVQSCVEMLDNSGFQVAVSHVEKGIRWNGNRSLKDVLFSGPPILGSKRLLSNRLPRRRLQEAAGEAG